jgi:hypothetical protein
MEDSPSQKETLSRLSDVMNGISLELDYAKLSSPGKIYRDKFVDKLMHVIKGKKGKIESVRNRWANYSHFLAKERKWKREKIEMKWKKKLRKFEKKDSNFKKQLQKRRLEELKKNKLIDQFISTELRPSCCLCSLTMICYFCC